VGFRPVIKERAFYANAPRKHHADSARRRSSRRVRRALRLDDMDAALF